MSQGSGLSLSSGALLMWSGWWPTPGDRARSGRLPAPQDCEGLEAQVRVLQGPGQSIFLGVRKKTSGCPGRQLGTETECPASLGGTGTRGVAATWY